MRAITYTKPNPDSDHPRPSLVVGVSNLNMPGHPTTEYLIEQEHDGHWAVYRFNPPTSRGSIASRVATLGPLHLAFNYVLTMDTEDDA